MTEKPVICYYFFIKGLFGRNRKVKQEMFYVKKYAELPLTKDQAIALMNEKLKELKPKGQHFVKLLSRNGTLKNDNGFEIYTTALFSDQTTIVHEERV